MEQILYFLLVCFCLLGTFYQCVQLLDLYFRYPYTVSISMGTTPYLDFPGITLCTTAFVTKQKIMDSCKDQGSGNRKLTECFSDFVAKESLDKILNQSINWYDFIADVRCAADEVGDEDVTCRSHLFESVITTFQGNAVCWTLFHKATFLRSRLSHIKVASGYKQSALLIHDQDVSSSRLNQSIEPREVIRFLLNFTTNESILSDEPVHGAAGVHDSYVVSQSRRGSMKIHAGRYYEIAFEKHETINLPAPYDSDCFDYREANLPKYKYGYEKTNPFKAPISSSDCFTGCMGVLTLQQNDCLCWPPEIPYMRGEDNFSSMVDEECNLCNWITIAKTSQQVVSLNDTSTENRSKILMRVALSHFRNCSASFEKECRRSCRKGCETIQMKTKTSESSWPSDEEIHAADDIQEKNELKRFRDCCTILSIKYSSNQVVVYTAQAKYEVIEFISYIGGIIGLWLGFTFVGMIDYAKAAIQTTRKLMKEYKKRTRRSNGMQSTISKDRPVLGRRKPMIERMPWLFEMYPNPAVVKENSDPYENYHRNFKSQFHVDPDLGERVPVVFRKPSVLFTGHTNDHRYHF